MKIFTAISPLILLLLFSCGNDARQHTNRAVSEFTEQGMNQAMQPTPLPAG